MYSELIYTRCGQGVDILKNGAAIENAGFKVFSCSPDVLTGGSVDLCLLQNVAQRKEYFSEPNFMDDAYHFLTPDFGGKILVNFHPRRFDKNETGDYAHRPGNFVNQIFVGQFGECYPYEFFGDESLWSAQKKKEAHYYKEAPAPLEERESLTPTKGWITVDDIAQFVADGRRDALKKAIAFILSQFSLPQEKRKYLVVKDENSKNIELWIAAIERAFSPRMAAGLSFTTRLDDFVNSNRYAVGLDGKFQAQIDYQNPNQKTRYRAMIVGIDDRDQDDAAAARPAPHLPFVVLDGKRKTISFDADVSDPYYNRATDCKQGASFCKDFLQIVDLSAPSPDVLNLNKAYELLARYHTEPQSNLYVDAIDILRRFTLLNSPRLRKLYDYVKGEFVNNLDNEATYSVVLPWLERLSAVVGDGSAATIGEELKSVACSTFVETIFTRPSDDKTDGVYRGVSQSPFAPDAARLLVAQETVSQYDVANFAAKDWRSFTEMFLASIKDGGDVPAETLAGFLRQSVRTCFKENDEQSAAEIVALRASLDADTTAQILLEEAQNAKDDVEQARFFLRLTMGILLPKISSAEDLDRFYAALKSCELDSHIGYCLNNRAETLESPLEKKYLLEWALSNNDILSNVSQLLETLDKNLDLLDKGSRKLARSIQDNILDTSLKCPNSAHVYALEILEESSSNSPSKERALKFEELASQGVPSVENEGYAYKFIESLFNRELPYEVFEAAVIAAIKSESYLQIITQKAVESRKNDVATLRLVFVVSKLGNNPKDAVTKGNALKNAIVDALNNLTDKDRNSYVSYVSKNLKKSKELSEDQKGKASEYFDDAIASKLELNRKKSFFARLFPRSH